MAKTKRIKPARYWEHTSVHLDIHEANKIIELLQHADLTNVYDGSCASIREKVGMALTRMMPDSQVCMACRHHKTYHKKRPWMKPGQVCGGNWPEHGPCKCKRFRGQR